jgi:hypothetical protein
MTTMTGDSAQGEIIRTVGLLIGCMVFGGTIGAVGAQPWLIALIAIGVAVVGLPWERRRASESPTRPTDSRGTAVAALFLAFGAAYLSQFVSVEWLSDGLLGGSVVVAVFGFALLRAAVRRRRRNELAH